MKFIYHLNIEERLDKAICNLLSVYSRMKIKFWIINGLVKVNGNKIIFPKKKFFLVI